MAIDPIQITPVPVSFISQGYAGVPQTVNSDPKFSGSAARDNDAEYKRLQSQHAIYAEYAPMWQFYRAAFEGGQSMTHKDNLFKHARENEDDFSDRVKRMRYDNYCDPLVTFFTDFIYAETIQRSGGKSNGEWFDTFCTDVNRKGQDLTTVMSRVSDEKDIYGMVYGLVDAPDVGANAVLTKQDEKDGKVKPYWLIISPLEILDWGVDDFGNYVYLKRYQKVDQTNDLGQKVSIERFTEWSAAKVVISDVTRDAKNNLVINKIERANKLGRIPVAVALYRESKEHPGMGIAFLRDIAPQNRSVMNLDSLQDEFLNRQCFNVMAMEMDTDIPRAEQEDGESGTSNVLLYPKGAKLPQYIAPSDAPASRIAEERRTIVAEMFRRAAQDTVNELFNGGGSSGFSKAQSFRTTVPRIASRAEALEKFEVQMFTLTYEYMGWDWDGSIKYKDHYEITNLADALSQMLTMFSELLIPSPTFAKEQMLRVISMFDGKIAPEVLKQIRHEVETANMTEWSDLQKLHYLGRAAQSPDVGTALGQAPAPVPGTSSSMATAGKDTPTAPSTAKKPQLNSKQVAATSSKTSK